METLTESTYKYQEDIIEIDMLRTVCIETL